MAREVSQPAGYDFVDSPGEQGNPVLTSTDLNCEYCGTGLIYAGRGTKPRFCDEHKKAKDRGEGEASKPVGRPTGKGASVARAVDTLSFVYKIAGTGLGYVDPAASAVVTANSDKLAQSYTRLLETNAKFLKLFETAEDKMAWMPIVIMHSQIVMAIVAAHNGASLPKTSSDDFTSPSAEYTGSNNVYNFPSPDDVPIV